MNRYKSSIGKSPITPTNWSYRQTGNLMFRGTSNATTTFDGRNPSVFNAYFGFATKGCDVIEFFGTSLAPGGFHASSANGFSTLCSPSDTCPALDIVEKGSILSSGASMQPIRRFVGVTKGDGSAFVPVPSSIPANGIMCIYENPATAFKDPVDVVPYGSALVTNEFLCYPTISSTLVNNDGIRSKGFTNVEFIATNAPYDPTTLNLFRPYNNGNYLCFAYLYISNQAPYSFCRIALYCGWDPDNPDITQAGAWTEYAD